MFDIEKKSVFKWHGFKYKYRPSVLKLQFNCTIFLNLILLSVIKPPKNINMSCYPKPLVDCIHKVQQISKVKKLTLQPMRKFFISSFNAF